MNKTNILISVILPVYNAENFLKESIDSILNQSFTNFELIIINDGSTDSSEKIILNYTDKRIVYIKNNENSGLISTLNKGINLSNGKYIARMDADDISLPARFQYQWDFMEKNLDIDVCGTSIVYFNKEGDIKEWKVPIKDDEIKIELFFGPGFSHPSVFFRAKRIKELEEYYSFNCLHVEDYEFWIRLSKIGFKFHNLEHILLKYRLHDNNVGVANSIIQNNNHLKLQISYFEYYLNRELSNRELLLFDNSEEIKNSNDYLLTSILLLKEILNSNRLKRINNNLLSYKMKYFFLNKINFTDLNLFRLLILMINYPFLSTVLLKKYLRSLFNFISFKHCKI